MAQQQFSIMSASWGKLYLMDMGPYKTDWQTPNIIETTYLGGGFNPFEKY